MLDTCIMTDKRLESNRPDITLLHKIIHEWILTDIAIALDKNIVEVKQMKIHRYQNLAGKIEEFYQTTDQVVRFMVGAFKTIFRNISTSRDTLCCFN